jgi:hypothetical protein
MKILIIHLSTLAIGITQNGQSQYALRFGEDILFSTPKAFGIVANVAYAFFGLRSMLEGNVGNVLKAPGAKFHSVGRLREIPVK